VNDLSFDSSLASHRRAFSTVSEAEHTLPQLTSPLSPPAFNPADIILGSNEAIAGLDSPALSMALPKTPFCASGLRRNDDAFNWLESTMSDLKIGKKDSLAAMSRQGVHRNANVFQFPSVDPAKSFAAAATASRCLSYQNLQVLVYTCLSLQIVVIANICNLHILQFCYFESI
jgi:hypothetical protein